MKKERKMSNQQVATKKPTILTYINDKKDFIKAQIQTALPKHLSADRMLRVLVTEINKNPKLLNCSMASVLSAAIQCSQLGLEPGGALGLAYLMPFYNTNKGITECQFIVGYRGMIDLAMRSGKIINIRAKAVYSNDFFEYEDGLEIILKHKPNPNPNPHEKIPIIGAYAVAKFSNVAAGAYQVEFMYKNEIDKIRSRSKSTGQSPWDTDYEEMAKKTVIRRLFKYLPISIEMQRAVALDEAADVGNQFDFFEHGEVLNGLDEEEPKTQSDAIAKKLGANANEERT